MKKQAGSAHVIIVTALVVVLIGALGFIFWQNFIQKTSETDKNANTTSETDKKDDKLAEVDEDIAEQGTIVGSLTYPSEGIPPSMEIHATNLATNEDFFTNDHLPGDHYKYRSGYRLSVPAGNYYVYSTIDETPDERHYYNNLVDKCDGVYENCTDAGAKVIVTVESNKETKDIMAGWSMPCVIPGGEQPTEKFDLPTC